MAKKKKNSRKVLAVALGIMGIAGLSMASASQLTVNSSNEVQIGVSTFANCQGTTPITVDYTYVSPVTPTTKITAITFGGIVSGCDTKTLTFTLAYTDASNAVVAASPIALATPHTLITTEVNGGTYSYTIPATAQIPLNYNLGDVTVIIK